jgi:hypothetical protein
VSQVLTCIPEEEQEGMGEVEGVQEGRSVFAFDMSVFRSSVTVGKADIQDYLLRSLLLAGPNDVVLYDADRPIPDRYLEYLEGIGLGAYQYFPVAGGDGTLFERALRDHSLCRNLDYLQQQDGKALVLKPYTPRPDAELFADRRSMAYFFGPYSSEAAKLSNKAEIRTIVVCDLKLRMTDGMLCEGSIAIRHFAEEFLAAGHKIVIKENLINGAGGTGFTHIDPIKDEEGKFGQLEDYLKTVPCDLEVMVERWHYTARPSPSALVRVSRDALGKSVVKVVQFTDQILTKRGKWVGNTIPCHLSPNERRACRYLARKIGHYVAVKFQYSGIFGIDFLMVPDEVSKKDVPIIAEVNFRFVGSVFLDRVVRAKQHKGVANCSILNGVDGTGCDYAVVQEIVSRLPTKSGDYVIPHNIRCFADGEGALMILAKTEKDVAIYQGTILQELQRRKYGGEPPRPPSKRCIN